MDTMKLSTTWDLMLDAGLNIAKETEQAALAQDVASAIMVFQGELYYDIEQGVPYQTQILGQEFSGAFIKSAIEAAALSVPGVISAVAEITSFDNRTMAGTVKVIDTVANEINLHF